MDDSIKADPTALVSYITRGLVKNPDDVVVVPFKGPSSLVLELRVNKDDTGTVIGKGGRIAKSIRSLLSAISMKKIALEDGTIERYSKAILEIVDD